MTIDNIWILGAGHFGKLAVERLKQSGKKTTITIVDQDPEKLHFDGVKTICDDAIQWLCQNLTTDYQTVDIIIPSIPVHVAAEWLTGKLKENRKKNYPELLSESFFDSLPNPIRTGPCQLLASFADFICPSSCDEPEDYCTQTGEKRAEPLFRLLERLCPDDFTPFILQSHQLFPGIGGLYPQDLQRLYDHALKAKQEKILVGSACRCHGIVDGFLIR